MNCFIILPNQLFDIKYLKNYKDYKFFLIEEPLFFGDSRRVKNFSKLKLVLHRASMKFYFDYLKENKIDVEYVEFNELTKKSKGYSFLKKFEFVTIYDPVDHLFLDDLEKYVSKSKKELTIIDSPLFLLTRDDLD